MPAKKAYLPKFTLTEEPQPIKVAKIKDPLNGPGRDGQYGAYYILEVEADGGLSTWFVDKNQARTLVENSVAEGTELEVWEEGTGEYKGKREIKALTVNVLYHELVSTPTRTPARPAREESKGPVVVPDADGWAVGYRLVPDLRTVPTNPGGMQADLMKSLCGPVGEYLMNTARKLMTNPASPDNPSDSAVQACFATLVIQWKDLGYPPLPCNEEEDWK